jgi:UPF0755 protein
MFRPGGEVHVELPSGGSASQATRILADAGVVRWGPAFRIYLKLTRSDRSLKPGRYLFHRGDRFSVIVRRLRAGDVEVVRVVIPEGFMARQIADRLEAAGVTGSAQFMEYVRRNNLEGFLFPSTYFFGRNLSAEQAAHNMHEEFRRRVEPEFQRAGQDRFNLAQVVTLASIVQREARILQEMPMIAAVYSNRLKKRMRLEADPTVQYALGKDTGQWKKGITYKDLDTQSPYNTYANFGLPPGPICSPGLDAVRAALKPAEADVIFFVADDSGGHVFTRTLEEHVAAKQRIKRERRQHGAAK